MRSQTIENRHSDQQLSEFLTVRVKTVTDTNAYYYSVSPDPGSNNSTKKDIADSLIDRYKEAWDRLAE
jgi:hypothetical protein